MAFEATDFAANIAAVAGDDPVLQADLRRAFAESVACHVDLLGRARCDANWAIAAGRLRSLAASFHDHDLGRLAERALEGAPGDPRIVRLLADRARDFSRHG